MLKGDFFPPESAYKVDTAYLNDINGWSTLTDSTQKEYGVRDEYRCRASSLKRLLPLLKKKVCD